MTTLLLAFAAYLLGSLPFAVITSRAFGLADPRTYGSGNPGATNVLRSGNKAAAVLTLLGDGLKGWLAVWAVQRYGAQWGTTDVDLALVAFAVFIGHVFPLFLGFKGGKGVATAAGVLFGLSVWLGLATVGAWLVVAVLSRYSSLAALGAAVFAPLAGVWVLAFRAPALAVFAMSVVLVWRHADNIRRLRAGTESRIGDKKKAAVTATDPH